MITTTTDKAINLSQLDQELGGQGLCLNEVDANAKIVGIADGSKLTLAQLNAGIASHIAIDTDALQAAAKAAAQAKLAALGLTTDDLKALGLGGNE